MTNMTDRTFTLSAETIELPLVVTQTALADFRIQGLAVMDECLHNIAGRSAPANDPQTSDPQARPPQITDQDMIGQMMLDGMATGNTRKVILCALWLAHYLPHATGLVSDGNKFHYVFGETDAMAQQTQVCA